MECEHLLVVGEGQIRPKPFSQVQLSSSHNQDETSRSTDLGVAILVWSRFRAFNQLNDRLRG